MTTALLLKVKVMEWPSMSPDLLLDNNGAPTKY